MINYAQSQSKVLTDVDALIRAIMSDKTNINTVMLALNYLYPIMMYYDDSDLEHTETVRWFIGTAQLLKGDLYPDEVVWDRESAQRFMDLIQAYRYEFLQSKAYFQLVESNNTNSLVHYLKQMFDHYSRLLVVRVDLKYKVESQSKVTVQDFNDHIGILRDRMRRKKGVFKSLEGYAWALEQGYELNHSNGLHCHLVLLYDGSKRHKGSFIGQQITEKWIEITERLGYYFNCNDPNYLNPFIARNEDGIGMIHRNDSQQVQRAINTISYLTTKPDKFEQRLKTKVSGMRTFGHGTYRTKKRRGLPPITN